MQINQLPVVVRHQMETAKVPVIYTDAVRSLAECRTLDEAKYWDTRAEALAAWARIYKNDLASVEAKRLKLHAYRRMCEIADELRPNTSLFNREDGRIVKNPGPASLLKEHGLSLNVAAAIRRIGAIPAEQFTAMVERADPPSITRAADFYGRGGRTGIRRSDLWNIIMMGKASKDAVGGAVGVRAFLLFCRKTPAELAAKLRPSEAALARAAIIEIQEWSDRFEQCLTKEAPKRAGDGRQHTAGWRKRGAIDNG